MALSNSDDSLSKANKAQVMYVLEDHGNPSKDPELFAQAYVNDKENTGVFIDHMAIVQKCSSRSGISTFGDVLRCMCFRFSVKGIFVALISDRYDLKLSIKAGEMDQVQVLPRNISSKAYSANPKNKDNSMSLRA